MDIYNDSVPVEIEKRFKIPTKNKKKKTNKEERQGRKAGKKGRAQ